MKKALIICAVGMSSSLMAKKATDYLKDKGLDIQVDATLSAKGEKVIREAGYDLYLISPQAKMFYDRFKKIADEVDRPLELIPFQAYAPIPSGVQKLAELIEENIK